MPDLCTLACRYGLSGVYNSANAAFPEVFGTSLSARCPAPGSHFPPLFQSCIGLQSGLYEPLLAESERDSIGQLLRLLEGDRDGVDFFSGEALHALSILSSSDSIVSILHTIVQVLCDGMSF